MSTPSYAQHRHDAEPILARSAVLTLSDTRTAADDTGGDLICSALLAAGHTVGFRELLPDSPARLSVLLESLLRRDDLDAIFTTGGTGISRRDQTIEVIEAALLLKLDGFGELFRMLSWQQIGSGAMLSRAVGGVAAVQGGTRKLLLALPGSPAAVELGMSKLILPELKHLLRELRR